MSSRRKTCIGHRWMNIFVLAQDGTITQFEIDNGRFKRKLVRERQSSRPTSEIAQAFENGNAQHEEIYGVPRRSGLRESNADPEESVFSYHDAQGTDRRHTNSTDPDKSDSDGSGDSLDWQIVEDNNYFFTVDSE